MDRNGRNCVSRDMICRFSSHKRQRRMNPSQEDKRKHHRSLKLECRQSETIKGLVRVAGVEFHSTYNVCEERIFLDLIFWDNEAFDEFVSVQVEDSNRVRCPLLW